MAGLLALLSFYACVGASLAATAQQTSPSLDLEFINATDVAISAQNTTNKTVVAQTCQNSPSEVGYVIWQCPAGTIEGGQCTGQCVAGAVALYGPPLAVCSGGKYIISRTCMAGYAYSFDDVSDGSFPTAFLGLKIQGLRVTRSDTYNACDGRSGYRTGVISPPNVAYSLEVGAADDLTNLVRIEAPSKASKISVFKFWATAAWQDKLNIDVSAYDAANTKLALRRFTLSFSKPTLIDLSSDLRFSGIHRLTIVTSGGTPVSCQTGKQMVIDDLAIYIHGD